MAKLRAEQDAIDDVIWKNDDGYRGKANADFQQRDPEDKVAEPADLRRDTSDNDLEEI